MSSEAPARDSIELSGWCCVAMPPIGLVGGFFRHGQRYRGGDASAFTAALNSEVTAQFRNALLHSAQTDSDSCPGMVKAGKLFGGDTPAIVSYRYHRILIV